MLKITLAPFQRRVALLAQARSGYARFSCAFATSRSSFQRAILPRQGLSHSVDTIYALSTAPGKAAIAVIRISGPACIEIYHALCPNRPLPRPRYASLRALHDPTLPMHLDSVLDFNALVLFFPGPQSATGEDVLELHVHGGTAVIQAVLRAISRYSFDKKPVRYAEAGEFTQRAFFNDRLDLTQVEALGDVLAATTEQQRKLAMRGTTRTLKQYYEQWRMDLLFARGELEALIDFSEDQHFEESPAMLASAVTSKIKSLKTHIEVHVENAMRGELLRRGINVALLGAPNVGKSSLFNRIVGREAAIVSEEAGTTRDIVEVGVDLGGYLCHFSDMAGLRSKPSTSNKSGAIGAIEMEGIKRAKERALESDLVVVVTEVKHDSKGQLHLPMDAEIAEVARQCAAQGIQILVVVNKIDLNARNGTVPGSSSLTTQVLGKLPFIEATAVVKTCCVTSKTDGIREFLAVLVDKFALMTAANSAENPPELHLRREALGASERHRLLLEESLRFLGEFLSCMTITPEQTEDDIDIVVAAESLRAASDCLTKITGRGNIDDVDEVLGVVFEKFCVGK